MLFLDTGGSRESAQSGSGRSDKRVSTIFDNLVIRSAHDVVVAYCLAMAEVWVQFPLGALSNECRTRCDRRCEVA